MPRVSILPISNQLKEKVERAFPTMLSSLRNPNEVNDFTKNFLTAEEQMMMGKRLVLYVLLYKGTSARQIKSSLGISLEAIRVHKINYLKLDQGAKNLIKRLAEKLFYS